MKTIHIFALWTIMLVAIGSPAFAQQQPSCESPYIRQVLQATREELPFTPPAIQGYAHPVAWDTPPTPDSVADNRSERLIIFMHGLHGNAQTWANVALATDQDSILNTGAGKHNYPRRSVVTSCPEFSTQAAFIATASSTIRTELNGTNGILSARTTRDTTKTIVIAKSLGGLVMRNLNQSYTANPNSVAYPRRFNGLVTVSTPHRGAPVAENTALLTQFAQTAADDLSKGPTSGTVYSIQKWADYINWALGTAINIDSMRSELARVIAGTIVEKVGLTVAVPDIMKELRPGISVLNTLNNWDSVDIATNPNTIPRVSFYGVEDGPEMWRELRFLAHSPTLDSAAFASNYDSTMIHMADSAQQHYYDAYSDQEYLRQTNELKYQHEKKVAWTAAAMVVSSCGVSLLNPSVGGICAGSVAALSISIAKINKYNNARQKAEKARDDWHIGYNWWTTANDRYLLVIGGRTIRHDSTISCRCVDEGKPNLPVHYYPAVNGVCLPHKLTEECSTHITYKQVITHHDNDGMVPAWSSGSYPGLDPLLNIKVDNKYFRGDPKLRQGSNHEQINNCENTAQMLKDLFDGQIQDASPFFQTSEYH